MKKSNQEAVPYLCTVSSELDEPLDRNGGTVFPEFALFFITIVRFIYKMVAVHFGIRIKK